MDIGIVSVITYGAFMLGLVVVIAVLRHSPRDEEIPRQDKDSAERIP